MDLRNGDVLAMASHPTYDPNWLVGGITTLEYQSVFENPYAPGALNNRAVQGLYSPGSVFKLVTALAGLEARLISPRAAFYDVGYFQIPTNTDAQAGAHNQGTTRNRICLGYYSFKRRVLLPSGT